jgi:hypothetical protein
MYTGQTERGLKPMSQTRREFQGHIRAFQEGAGKDHDFIFGNLSDEYVGTGGADVAV